MRTLIVEASSQVREHLVSLVSHLESVELVGEARDVQEAYAVIQTLAPDVVIMDPLTPGGELRMLQKIKELAPNSVIVMLAFYPYTRYRADFLNAGADYVLDKLTDVKHISQVLESLVQAPE